MRQYDDAVNHVLLPVPGPATASFDVVDIVVIASGASQDKRLDEARRVHPSTAEINHVLWRDLQVSTIAIQPLQIHLEPLPL